MTVHTQVGDCNQRRRQTAQILPPSIDKGVDKEPILGASLGLNWRVKT